MKRQQRAAAGGRVVDDMARAVDEALEVRDSRIAGEAAPGEREIGGGAAVAAAEQQHARRAELLGPPAGVGEQRLELLPRGAALAQKSVYVHTMEFEDVLTITTPEGVDVQLALAGRRLALLGRAGRRADPGAAASSALTVALRGPRRRCTAGARSRYSITLFVVIFGYDILFEVLSSGRTPGKRLNGLRVVRVGGFPIGFLASAIRNTLRLIDFLPSAYLVGCVAILVTEHNQRLGDLAAGTLVVRERKATSTLPPPRPARREAGVPDAGTSARSRPPSCRPCASSSTGAGRSTAGPERSSRTRWPSGCGPRSEARRPSCAASSSSRRSSPPSRHRGSV